jgi:hypothetical protein
MTINPRSNTPPVPKNDTSRRVLAASALIALACTAAAVQWGFWDAPAGATPMVTAAPPPQDAESIPQPAIDHSVVKSRSIADEPDMTGASVAAYDR